MYWLGALVLAVCGLAFLGMRQRGRRLRQDQLDRQRALELIRYLRQLIELLQRHRGLCFGAMSGEARLQSHQWTARQQINQHLAQAGRFQSSLHWYAGWQALPGGWERICRQDEDREPGEVLAEHTALIQHVLGIIRELADRHDFICLGGLAPQPRGAWLELLEHSELLGQCRALGTGIAAHRQDTPKQREALRGLRQSIADAAYLTLASLYADPVLRSPLRQSIEEAETRLDSLIELIDRLVAGGSGAAIHSVDYFQSATRAIAAHFALIDLLLSRLEQEF